MHVCRSVLTKGRLDDGRGRVIFSSQLVSPCSQALTRGFIPRVRPGSASFATNMRSSRVGHRLSGWRSWAVCRSLSSLRAHKSSNFLSLFCASYAPSLPQTTKVDVNGREVLPSGAMASLGAQMSDDPGGGPVQRKQQLSWDEICKRAAKVVGFIGECEFQGAC